MLTGKGFREAEGAGGDVYYLGPGHRILWLYPDGAWYVSDGVSQELTLEAYLASAFRYPPGRAPAQNGAADSPRDVSDAGGDYGSRLDAC